MAPYGEDNLDEYDYGSGTRLAQRLKYQSYEDSASQSSASRMRDRELMDSITSRLYKLDFDTVKVGDDVAYKTGFRRKMYQKQRPLEKGRLEKRRREELLRPWDYTQNSDVFRNSHRALMNKKKSAIQREAEKARAAADKRKGKKEKEVEIDDRYPEYDPLGLYRPKPKREHKPLPPKGKLPGDRYEDRPLRELVAEARAKVASMPVNRQASNDVAALLEGIDRPLPKGGIQGFTAATVSGISDEEVSGENYVDERITSKISQSRNEIQDFEKMLDSMFSSVKDGKFLSKRGAKTES